MLRFAIAFFVILHGLVHLLYAGQSRRLFELQPGLQWPDGSWAVARLLGEAGTRSLASGVCVLATLGLVVGGVGLLLRAGWASLVIVGAAVLSALMYVLLWDGTLYRLPDQGAIGVLIDLAIITTVALALPRSDSVF